MYTGCVCKQNVGNGMYNFDPFKMDIYSAKEECTLPAVLMVSHITCSYSRLVVFCALTINFHNYYGELCVISCVQREGSGHYHFGERID